MTSVSAPALDPRDLLSAMVRRPALWLIPTLLLAAAAAAYAWLVTPPWEATMPLLVRDEAVGMFRRPGQFESVDALKTAQETCLEIARSRAVVRAALQKIGPPEDYIPASELPADQWPTKRDVEDYQRIVKIQPPKGGELGKTEVFYLAVRDKTPERSVALADAICDEMENRLQLMRDRKSTSLVSELTKTVTMSRADLNEVTGKLAEVEVAVGPDLGELRILSESSTGDSNLRQNLNEIKTQLMEARKRQKTNQELFASLAEVKANPTKVTAVPISLLSTQPSLQRIKDAYVDACLACAKLKGDFSDQHPRLVGARAAENEVRSHLEAELRDTLRTIQADIKLQAGLIEQLDQQHADVQARMQKLAGLRAVYANLVADVRHHSDILRKSVQDLSEARAGQAAAETASQLTRIDEPSTGSKPVGPSQAIIVVAGVFGGLMTGVGSVLASLQFSGSPPANPITLVPADWVEPLRDMVDRAADQSWKDAVAQVVPARFRQS